MAEGSRSSWYSRYALERLLAAIYLIAFLVAANQFVALCGEHGLLPAPDFINAVPFSAAPSLFFFVHSDRAFVAAAWTGVALSGLALTGLPQRFGSIASALVWFGLWILYLSFVNVGQTFYAFGWETLLLEVGFFAMFAGGARTDPPVVITWIWRWTLFRLMFGAGLIKLRGDQCWRDLTCLDVYFETQPIPNPLSWYFHHLPPVVHHAGVAINHLVEVVVPFLYFAPQPFAGIAGVATILFQLMLIVSGNLSWLNWLTIVLAMSLFDDRWLAWIPVRRPALAPMSPAFRATTYLVGGITAILSAGPVLNMLSPGQLMNSSFNAIHLVNTYGAFGSITRERFEIAIEGTDEAAITDATVWREYAFKGKPGDPAERPRQIAPYHLRLDWLMWFAAMASPDEHPWFAALVEKLLRGDRATLALLASNPFPDRPPRFVRARIYKYTFTSATERQQTGRWWNREDMGLYFPPASLP